MSRYSKNAVHRTVISLKDMHYLNLQDGYNVFQQNNAEGYSAIGSSDSKDRVDGLGSIAEVVDWIQSHPLTLKQFNRLSFKQRDHYITKQGRAMPVGGSVFA